MNNEYIFEAVKMSLLLDIKKVYEYYKVTEPETRGVELKFNISNGFGEYIYNNNDKLMELIEYFNKSISFPYRFIFEKEGEEEFYPLL